MDFVNNGQIFYRESSRNYDLDQGKADVLKAFPSMDSFYPTRVYIITYSEVPGKGNTLVQYNTFQTVIITNGTLSYLVFNFYSLTWPNSGFTKLTCLFGFTAGDKLNYYSYPGSYKIAVVNAAIESNVNTKGKFYKLHKSVVSIFIVGNLSSLRDFLGNYLFKYLFK